MSHDAFIEDLKSYLDGELPEVRQTEVAEHLRFCESCREELDALADMSWQVALSREETEPEGLRLRLLDRFTAEASRKRNKKRLVWTLLPAAAAIGFGAYLVRPGPPTPRFTGTANAFKFNDNIRPGLKHHRPEITHVEHVSRTVQETQVELHLVARADDLTNIESRWVPIHRADGLIAFQVPASDLDALLDALRKSGNLTDVHRKDVETVGDLGDLDIRIDNLKQDQSDYLVQMRRATTVNEVVGYDQNIKRVREQLDALVRLRALFSHREDFATVTVHLDKD